MKYFMLLLLLIPFSLFAQSTIDFESVAQDTGWTVFANGASQNDTDFAVISNPYMTGMNTSAHVAMYTVKNDADPWSGIYTDVTPFTITAQNAHPTIMVYKSVTSRFDLKFEGYAGSADHFDSNTVENQWQQLTFDYSADIGKTVNRITIIPDFPTARTAGSINYFDNLEFAPPVVPVELTSFNAAAYRNGIELTWNTSTETNNSGFDIERSPDNINFQKIGFVKGFGTSTNSNSYSYLDRNVGGKFFYRLKQIDFNGSFKYSKTVEVNTSKPFAFVLNQNYPNPFNPSTTISYSIPEKSFVSIKIYNVLGNVVASLVNNQVDAGEHNVQFNAAGLSSGVYFYTIKAGNFSATKKLMLLK